MYLLFQFILAIIIYVSIVMAAYYATEVYQLPRWLRFPPFHCRKCLTFWSNIATALIIGLSFGLYWYMGLLIILGILTAIAMQVEEKNKTVKIDDLK